jgi:cytochrome c oxidase subunit 3
MSIPYQKYYVPHQSHWPIVGALAMLMIGYGAATLVVQSASEKSLLGIFILIPGIMLLIYMLSGWFSNVIDESVGGLYSSQMDRSFRQGMSWFIFSEVMFFAAFFGTLFYTRTISVPWLDGASNNVMTGEILWPGFDAVWPLIKTPSGLETQAMPWNGLPLYNTIILLASSITLHYAHIGIEKGKYLQVGLFMMMTILMGASFLGLQVYEYIHAYQHLNLRLDSGVYGNTFFMLTGFHGLHVTLGTIFLVVVFLRMMVRNTFTPERHFAFQAAAWYWHFVDVVWLCLFIFVYVL